MPYPIFDTSKLRLQPISNRMSNLTVDDIIPLDAKPPDVQFNNLDKVAHEIILARKKGAPVILFMGAHVLRRGNSKFIISLLEKGLVTHLAVNGAFAIHDFEFSLIGATTESVEKYIAEGQFGLWLETGQINNIVKSGNTNGLGLGESIGKFIFDENFPYKNISIFAAAYKNSIPITVHVSIGQDIIHEHPNFDAASFGESSYIDFLIFTQTLLCLEGGAFLNYGSAVTGPEVYLKALSMARNAAIQNGKVIKNFTTAVFDLIDLGEDYHCESPKDTASYYFRPYKTILVRTVKDGGKSFYIRGDHGLTFPALYRLLMDQKK
jgi:hypothetical protein